MGAAVGLQAVQAAALQALLVPPPPQAGLLSQTRSNFKFDIERLIS